MSPSSKREPEAVAVSWLAAVLRGERPGWPEGSTAGSMWRTGLEHGVLGLCHRALRPTPAWRALPGRFRRRLARHVKRAAAAELLAARELRQVLGCLRAGGIAPLLMKGVPIAYTHYPVPYLRPRHDTDLLFPDRARAEQALGRLGAMGYEAGNAIGGAFVSHQIAGVKAGAMGVTHTLDLHWKLSGTHRFSDTFSFSDLESAAIAVPGLDRDTRGLGPVHALLLACMHRLAHAPFGDENRLIWLQDIHLLAGSLSPTQWGEVHSYARRNRIGRTCLDGLRQAQRTFHTEVAPACAERLQVAADLEPFDLDAMRSRWRFELMNFRSLPDWSARGRLLREHLFPSAEYMAAKYRARGRLVLPALYLLRLALGLPKLFR